MVGAGACDKYALPGDIGGRAEGGGVQEHEDEELVPARFRTFRRKHWML